MIRKPASELAFVSSRAPLPTVEVDSDSIGQAAISSRQVALQVLGRLAEQDAALRATLHVYVTPSVNFRQPGLSEFFLVAGPKKVLLALGAAFERLPGVKSRFSDYVSASTALCVLHMEHGRVWEPEDADTWFCTELSQDDQDDADEEDLQPLEAEEDSDFDEEDFEEEADFEEEEDEAQDGQVVAAERRAARYRAARSDARVSTIRATIEEVFGLPAGSVALCGPDRRPLRGDARIRTLRKRWEDS